MSSSRNIITKLPPLPTIRELIRLYKLRALKHFSQNFILDLKLTGKIVRHAGDIENGEVCEVGPGPGNITRSILQMCPKKVLLVEKDTRFRPMLELLQQCTTTQIDIAFADIMGFDMTTSFSESNRRKWEDEPPNIHLIGNLPFNVSTHLIIMWLKDISLKKSAWAYGRVPMTLTFQHEVCERMVAGPSERQRCRLSVMCQNWCTPKYRFTIPGKAFVPKPDVDVGVMHIEPLIEPVIPVKFEIVEKVLRTVFNFRQKYSFKSVGNLFPEKQREKLTDEIYAISKLDPHRRAFEFTNEEWKRLIYAYCQICDREPRLYKYDFRACRTDFEKRWDILERDDEEVEMKEKEEGKNDNDSGFSEDELENKKNEQ